MNKVTPLVVVPGRECMSAGEAQRSPGVAVPPRRLRRRPLLCLAPGRGGRPLIERRPGRERLLPSPSGVPRPGRREGDGGRAASSGRAFFPAAARAGGRGAPVSAVLARASPAPGEGSPRPQRLRAAAVPAGAVLQSAAALGSVRAAGRRRSPRRLCPPPRVPRGSGLGRSRPASGRTWSVGLSAWRSQRASHPIV